MAGGSFYLNGQLTDTSGAVSSLPANTVGWVPSGAVFSKTSQAMASGDNTITIPAGTTMMIVVPPSTNTVALKTKSTGADAGEARHLTNPFVYTYPVLSPPANFIINAASSISSLFNIYFYGT